LFESWFYQKPIVLLLKAASLAEKQQILVLLPLLFLLLNVACTAEKQQAPIL
jgi:hypothetical protein